MTYIHDPDGQRLPIKLDTTSNGEFQPLALDAVNRQANGFAQARATENARRTGMSRRQFMVSAAGAASTLLAFNAPMQAPAEPGDFTTSTRKPLWIPIWRWINWGARNSFSTCKGTLSAKTV